ncbi:MAG: oligosaccharide flippase family protein [Rhodospirillaceae bacterium]
MPHDTLSKFLQNLAAYGLSEASSKASRLLVVVAVARTMDPFAIGLAAAAMASSDMLKAFTENGVTQRVIAASDADLESVCKSARRLSWFWCLGLCVLQAVLALGLYLSGANPLMALMLALLGLEYLFMPGGLQNCALAMREGKMKSTAAISGGQVVLANLLTAALVWVWPSPLAIILPKLLSAPVWLLSMRRLRPWSPDPRVARAPLRPFLRFGGAILGVEIVKAARAQADKLVVGLLLGTEALGVYFFVFNAGLGLATSFSTAFSVVLFPYLCRAADLQAAWRSSLLLALALVTPVVLLQAALAPVYVPLLFGDRWAGTEDVVAILCLAAIPGLIWTSVAQKLRAENRPELELAVTTALAVGLTGAVAIAAPHGLEGIAWSYLGVASVLQIGAVLPFLAGPRLPSVRKA